MAPKRKSEEAEDEEPPEKKESRIKDEYTVFRYTPPHPDGILELLKSIPSHDLQRLQVFVNGEWKNVPSDTHCCPWLVELHEELKDQTSQKPSVYLRCVNNKKQPNNTCLDNMNCSGFKFIDISILLSYRFSCLMFLNFR